MISENTPLVFNPPETGTLSAYCCKVSLRCKIITTIILAISVGALLILFVTLLVEIRLSFATSTHIGPGTLCQNGTVTRVQTRSERHSVLANVSKPTCSEAVVQLSLLTLGSSVEVRQNFCKDLAMQQFTVEGSLDNISFVNHPYPVFDDVKNYTESELPKNYFINGSIQVTLTNITTNSSSATLEVCLFTDNKEYYNFVDAGANWKAYTKNAECLSLSISNGGGDYEVSLNVSQPTFVFVGIASSQLINISHLYFNATGYDISDFGTNSTSVCQLSDDNKKCYFPLLNGDENICIVAFEEGTVESYDYSTIAITLPTPAKRYGKGPLYGFGFSSLATFILAAVLIMVSVFVCCRRRQGGKFTASNDGDTDRDTLQSVQNRTIQATTPEDTTAGTLVVASPINPSRVDKAEAGRVTPTEPSPAVNTPIQETKTSPTPSPTNNGQRLPVQENATQISSTVENYRTEDDTEPVFPPAFSETAPEQ